MHSNLWGEIAFGVCDIYLKFTYVNYLTWLKVLSYDLKSLEGGKKPISYSRLCLIRIRVMWVGGGLWKFDFFSLEYFPFLSEYILMQCFGASLRFTPSKKMRFGSYVYVQAYCDLFICVFLSFLFLHPGGTFKL